MCQQLLLLLPVRTIAPHWLQSQWLAMGCLHVLVHTSLVHQHQQQEQAGCHYTPPAGYVAQPGHIHTAPAGLCNTTRELGASVCITKTPTACFADSSLGRAQHRIVRHTSWLAIGQGKGNNNSWLAGGNVDRHLDVSRSRVLFICCWCPPCAWPASCRAHLVYCLPPWPTCWADDHAHSALLRPGPRTTPNTGARPEARPCCCCWWQQSC